MRATTEGAGRRERWGHRGQACTTVPSHGGRWLPVSGPIFCLLNKLFFSYTSLEADQTVSSKGYFSSPCPHTQPILLLLCC